MDPIRRMHKGHYVSSTVVAFAQSMSHVNGLWEEDGFMFLMNMHYENGIS